MIHSVKTLETNYSYIIEDSSRALIVDPGESDKIIDIIRTEGLIPSTILLTHRHNDHTGGVDELRTLFPGISIIDKNWDSLLTFNDQNMIDIIKTPGHTEDSCCFYLPKLGVLFTGDTLFTGLCGRIIDGSMDEMYRSLQILGELPHYTQVFPGHEYLSNAIDFLHSIGRTSNFYNNLMYKENPSTCTTIGDELINNPFMVSDLEKFIELRTLKGM